MSLMKRVLLGRPLATEEAPHQRLPKLLALPVFASDPLSSNAYATEEILLGLIVAGTVAFRWALPIAVVITVVLSIVIISYRQTVRAYPGGGGAYIVAKENLGELPGLVAAGALLTDYVLTVSVSIAAGAFALASLIPELLPHRVAMSLVFIVLITLANLRGVRESGMLFAIPTYGFVLSVFVLIGVGFMKCLSGSCPVAAGVHAPEPTTGLGLFVILRAFSQGSTALTGVEAIANGVPAFKGRRPKDQAHNAAVTLAMLGLMTIMMFLGLTILARWTDVIPTHEKSVIAQIADAVFEGGAGFATVQIMTALILILAANTAYQDFPRLSSILARDRYMPRQFMNLGDRLVFSNGIFVLAGLASALVVIYDAEVSRLIQLYVVGVFTSFTLSQSGMVVRWRRLRDVEPRWRPRAILNSVGASATGIVLIVIAVSKFKAGAWIVILAVPIIVLGFKAVHRHYASVAVQLRLPEGRHIRPVGTRAIVLVARVDEATMRAVGYARAMRPLSLRAMHVGREHDAEVVRKAWDERRLPIPLDIVVGDPKDITDSVRDHVRGLDVKEDEFITIVLPELYRGTGVRQHLHNRRTLLLKAALLFERRVVVTDIPMLESEMKLEARRPILPTRTIAVVLVSAVHNATMRAVEYAQALSPTDLRSVIFNVDSSETGRVLEAWGDRGVDVSLEAKDSPYREVTRPLVKYVREIRARNPDALVSVIIPEFVVKKAWHQILHNQTALLIKQVLLFEPGVVVTSVPFHLE